MNTKYFLLVVLVLVMAVSCESLRPPTDAELDAMITASQKIIEGLLLTMETESTIEQETELAKQKERLEALTYFLNKRK